MKFDKTRLYTVYTTFLAKNVYYCTFTVLHFKHYYAKYNKIVAVEHYIQNKNQFLHPQMIVES